MIVKENWVLITRIWNQVMNTGTGYGWYTGSAGCTSLINGQLWLLVFMYKTVECTKMGLQSFTTAQPQEN